MVRRILQQIYQISSYSSQSLRGGVTPYQKNRTKIMIVNAKIKQKSKTILGRIKNFDFILYFVTAYILYEKVSYTSTG